MANLNLEEQQRWCCCVSVFTHKVNFGIVFGVPGLGHWIDNDLSPTSVVGKIGCLSFLICVLKYVTILHIVSLSLYVYINTNKVY